MPCIAPAACGALIVLGLLNYIGIRESASLTAVLAVASLVVNLVVLVAVAVRLDAAALAPGDGAVHGGAGRCRRGRILVGFGSSWLAFSGLESISQIAPALREPREKTALRAMLLVIAGILLTSPLMTAFETALLDAVARATRTSSCYELGRAFGGRAARDRRRLTSSTLLLGAAEHRADRLLPRVPGAGPARLPAAAGWRSATCASARRTGRSRSRCWCPVAVVLATRGQMELLGDMYSFGLLGAFTLTSVGLDRLRVQEKHARRRLLAGPAHVGCWWSSRGAST